MNIRTAKARGRRLQDYVAQMIQVNFGISVSDARPAIMGENGMDIKLSTAARMQFPFAVECKNQEKLSIWKALEQSEKNSEGLAPLLVFKRNHSKVYVALDFETFIGILLHGL
jgi:hypothetical protein